MVGGYLWSLILLALTSLFLKGGSYLFTWPLLFNLGALGFVLARKRRATLSSKHLMLQVAGAVPGDYSIQSSRLLNLVCTHLTFIRSFDRDRWNNGATCLAHSRRTSRT